MITTEKSTPSSKHEVDYLLAKTDTFAQAKPENEIVPDEADSNSEETKNDELIFGKFKTMEEAYKSYKEAERAITRAAALEKKLQEYEAQAAKYEEDAVAHGYGFDDRLAMALDNDVRQRELDNYEIAARHMLSPELQLEVNRLIAACRLKGSAENWVLLRQYFTPEVIALASIDLADFKNWRQNEYEELRQKDKRDRLNLKLCEFSDKCGDWLDVPARAGLFSQALELTDGRVDLMSLKELIDAIESEAIAKHTKFKDAVLENEKTQESLFEPGGSFAQPKKKKWLTRAEYLKLSPQEEREKYDLIMEQIELEKQGLLPQMLLKNKL